MPVDMIIVICISHLSELYACNFLSAFTVQSQPHDVYV